MIIGSYRKLEVGKRYNDGGIQDHNLNKHAIPLFVIREATFEEWAEEVIKECGNKPNYFNIAKELAENGDAFFFEVSID